MPHVLLLYPPQQTFYGPHLGLPSLAAFLRERGVTVTLRDLNLETNRRMLTAEWLRRTADLAAERWRDAAPEPVQRALGSLEDICAQLPGALRTLSDPDAIHDDRAVAGAFGVLGGAYAILSAPFHPTALGAGCELPPDLRTDSWDGLMKARTAPENPWPFHLPDQGNLLEGLEDNPPDLIGIGVTYEDQLLAAVTLADRLRAALPDVPIVGGGALMTRLLPGLRARGELLPGFDYLIAGEGESALVGLTELLADAPEPGADALRAVPNLVSAESGAGDGEDGLLFGPAHREAVDELPTPDFRDLDLDGYLLPEPVVPLLTSRGCYWGRCGFCAHHLSYGDGRGADTDAAPRDRNDGDHGCGAKQTSQRRTFRRRSDQRVSADLDALAERHGASLLYLVDEAIPPRTLRAIAAHQRKSQSGHSWFGDVRMERALRDDLLGDLHDAGCRLLIFGLESGSQRVLDHMDKGIDQGEAARILATCHSVGIRTVVMAFVGFPTETVREAQETAQFLALHDAHIDALGVGSFTLRAGAPAHTDPARFGVAWIADAPETDLGDTYAYRPLRGLDAASASRVAESLDRRARSAPHRRLGLPRELLALRMARSSVTPR